MIGIVLSQRPFKWKPGSFEESQNKLWAEATLEFMVLVPVHKIVKVYR